MAQDQQMEYWVIPINIGNELGKDVTAMEKCAGRKFSLLFAQFYRIMIP
jgi:hypothetical protein